MDIGQPHYPGGLFNPFYQYFLAKWHDPSMPEYSLETDELIYRDETGNEMRRSKIHFKEPDSVSESGSNLTRICFNK